MLSNSPEPTRTAFEGGLFYCVVKDLPMKTVEWVDGKVRLIDQTRLPLDITFVDCSDYHQVAVAIKEMKVRGAPAIGVTAAYGIALGARSIEASSREEFLAQLEDVMTVLGGTRPTAVNLFWAIERMRRLSSSGILHADLPDALLEEACLIADEDIQACKRMGAYGAELIGEGFNVLTHCNAGALATVEYGTALGVIRAAHEQGKRIHVYADETRPLLQGARLTAWELVEAGIPVTLISDNMAGHFMSKGKIDCVVVGADRIAANGDVANKIGTYSVAVLAKENNIPFYVAAPISTVDISLTSGTDIPIEERHHTEVTHIRGAQLAPHGVDVANPAFDVTPNRYVKAIITEKGIVRAPFEEGLRRVVGS